MKQATPFSILIIDDDPSNFSVIKFMLLGEPYTLHYVTSGAEALESLNLLEPDIILLDVMMPGLDGIQVCQQIKAMPEWKAVPIIMVTALNLKEDLAQCLEAGADDFISKPLNKLELRARVHSMLRIRQQYNEIQSLSQLKQQTIALLEYHLQQLRGSLTSRLGHELKTPLNGILVSIQLLTDEVRRTNCNSENINDLLNILHESSLRLEKLTRRFLNYSRLELKRLDSQTIGDDHSGISQQYSDSKSIQEIATTIAQNLGRTEDLFCQIEEVRLTVSKQHLQWIIEELVENAFKFSETHKPVTINGQCQEQFLHLQICNLGRGMTDEQIANIGAFMQFERDTYEQQGMGLGLVIAQRAIELYGGTFVVSSLYDQMKVSMTLPCLT